MYEILLERDIERFWSKLNKNGPNGCWLWTGLASRGYGVFNINRRGLKCSIRVHRLAWEIANNEILPKDDQTIVIDHLCHNTLCCNPDHLEKITRILNTLRGMSCFGINYRKTHCAAGHEHSKENTIYDHRGRICKACKQKKNREAYHRKRYQRLGLADFCERDGCPNQLEHICQLKPYYLDGNIENHVKDNILTVCSNCYALLVARLVIGTKVPFSLENPTSLIGRPVYVPKGTLVYGTEYNGAKEYKRARYNTIARVDGDYFVWPAHKSYLRWCRIADVQLRP